LRRCPWLRILVRQWPFWALSLAFIPVALAFQSVPHGETTPVRQVLVAARNFLWYAGKTFVPVRLCPIYPKVEFTTLHIVGLTAAYAGGIVLAFLVWLRHRAVFLGLVFPFVLCYGVTLSPVSGLVPLGYVDMSDRYSYIPSAFLWLLAGFLFQLVAERFDWVPRLTRVAVVMVLAAGGAFMLESASYARLWQDIGTLTEAACRREPANVFALGQFGDIALDRGNLEDALLVGGRLAAAQRTWMTPEARQRALRRGLYLQGFALYGLGRPADALAAFEVIAPTLESTVYHQPTNNAAIWAMMADCYLRKGQVEQAIACYDSILERVREGSFEDHFYRGLRAVHKGDFAEGAAQFEQALVLRPDHAVARSNLAECRRRLDEDGNEGETDQ
jgi:pentatricopeptide repeat protein